MGVLRLSSPDFDFTKSEFRQQLFDTLYLVSRTLSSLKSRVLSVEEAEVKAVPAQGYPIAAGQLYTGQEGGTDVGQVVWRASDNVPALMLLCDGSVVSRTTYTDLFAEIGTTYNTGGESGSEFRLPNLQRRTIVGKGGTGTGTLGNTTGSTGGAETHTLTSAEMPTHTHTGPSHTHNISHTHTIEMYSGAGSSSLKPVGNINRDLDNGDYTTSAASTSTSGSGGTGATGSAGSGGSHNNMQPSIVMSPYIRFALGPSDVVQALPVAWAGLGGINGQWQVSTAAKVPVTAVENVVVENSDTLTQEAFIKISALNGSTGGTASDHKIVGLLEVPYNFDRFRPEAMKFKFRIRQTGVSANTTATLRVTNPVTGVEFSAKAETYTQSAGTMDSGYVEFEVDRDTLGRDWKPGYLFKFSLTFAHPLTFTLTEVWIGKAFVGFA